ncbi:chlorophyllase [Streptomyces sp. NBS 14/10]|uniref:alpha/beta hydrolase family protein n=1 Tax=Streptomyces sp. NBS 14/10 TaxID=1945643 RepID=UPI00211AC0B4|nr:chlorophyllase [Streptomyces sp. NBS 14/10]KAK1182255.1 chlorophyllase [Streptomyces sp. NBS 14/10]
MTATTVLSVAPVIVPTSDRGTELHVRVTAPAVGDGLSLIVFSHGFGSSMSAYAPLVDHWAAHGFVVVQPTHLDSRTLAIPQDDPRVPDMWRHRINDLTAILDHLDLFEAALPGLAGRLDRDRIAVAGHSWGATTASALLGARIVDADGRPGPNMGDPRVRAGVLLALAGHGQEDLTPWAAEQLPSMNPDFALMSTPALIVYGDHDHSPMTTREPDWWSDGYHQSPQEKALLVLHGAEHSLGGVSGYGVTETTDENPEHVALVNRAATAFLRHALGLGDAPWKDMLTTLTDDSPLGRLTTK